MATLAGHVCNTGAFLRWVNQAYYAGHLTRADLERLNNYYVNSVERWFDTCPRLTLYDRQAAIYACYMGSPPPPPPPAPSPRDLLRNRYVYVTSSQFINGLPVYLWGQITYDAYGWFVNVVKAYTWVAGQGYQQTYTTGTVTYRLPAHSQISLEAGGRDVFDPNNLSTYPASLRG